MEFFFQSYIYRMPSNQLLDLIKLRTVHFSSPCFQHKQSLTCKFLSSILQLTILQSRYILMVKLHESKLRQFIRNNKLCPNTIIKKLSHLNKSGYALTHLGRHRIKQTHSDTPSGSETQKSIQLCSHSAVTQLWGAKRNKKVWCF